MAHTTGKARLIAEAINLKKAWLVCVGIVGRSRFPNLTHHDLQLPDYANSPRRHLQDEVARLLLDLSAILEAGVEFRVGHAATLRRIASWLADRYDEWIAAGGTIFPISTVADFERHVGRLRAREHMEAPAYGEMLLQGFWGLAIRHPEYTLVRDLGLLLDLLNDAGALIDQGLRHDQQLAATAGENEQSLARATIISCFNLLEAFSNGLAREYVMTMPETSETASLLIDDRQALHRRLPAVVRRVSGGRCSLDANRSPMSIMFGEIKKRRDAFIHCEPGTQHSSRGYSKQEAFYDVSPALVNEAVLRTFEIIRLAWFDVHQRSGPKWLPEFQNGRFGKDNLGLSIRSPI